MVAEWGRFLALWIVKALSHIHRIILCLDDQLYVV